MDLKELLGEELYNSVMAKLEGTKHKVDVVSDGSKWITKDVFNATNEEKKQLQKTVKERDDQITALSKDAAGNEELQKKIADLTEANRVANEQYEADKKALRIENALVAALTDKANNPATVKRLIDLSKIELNEDGSIKAGLDDQLKALKESDAYLFKSEAEPEEKKGAGMTGVKAGGGKDGNGGSPGKSAAEIAAEQANRRMAPVQTSAQNQQPAFNPWG